MENEEFGVAPEGQVSEEEMQKLSKPKPVEQAPQEKVDLDETQKPEKEEEEEEAEKEEEPTENELTEEEKELEKARIPKGYVLMKENDYADWRDQFQESVKKLLMLEKETREREAARKRKPQPIKVRDVEEKTIPNQKNPFFWLPALALVGQLIALMLAIFLGFHIAFILLMVLLLVFVGLFIFAGQNILNWLFYSLFHKKNWGYMLIGQNGVWDLVFKRLPEEQKFKYKDEAGVRREMKSRIYVRKWLKNLGTQFVVVKRDYSNSLDLDAMNLDDYFPEIQNARENAQNARMALKSGMELTFDKSAAKPMDWLLIAAIGISAITLLAVVYMISTQPEQIKELLVPFIESVKYVPPPVDGSTITPG